MDEPCLLIDACSSGSLEVKLSQLGNNPDFTFPKGNMKLASLESPAGIKGVTTAWLIRHSLDTHFEANVGYFRFILLTYGIDYI